MGHNSTIPRIRRGPRMRPLLWLTATIGLTILIFWSTGCMERLFYLPTREPVPLAEAPPGTIEVRFESRDGTPLHGWLIPAHGRSDAMHEAPTVLHVHGNAGNIRHHAFFTEHLPRAGINVFLFDYRGYGESGGRATRRGPLIEDTEAALDALLGRRSIDPRRIGVYGQSLGGSIAINVMACRTEIRAAVFESPFASWRGIAANAVGGDPPAAPARWLAALLISDQHRPIDAIAGIDRPILLVHGDDDSIIPISHSRRLARAGGESVRLVEFPGGEHNSLRQTHPEIDALVSGFFHEHLGENPAQSADRP